MKRSEEYMVQMRLVLLVIGALAGFVEYFLVDHLKYLAFQNFIPSLYIGIAVFAILLFLTLAPESWRRDVLFSLALGILAAGYFYIPSTIARGWYGVGVAQGVAINLGVAALTFIPVVFYQTTRDVNGWSFPYKYIFQNAWQNKIVILVAFLFTIVCWLLIFLCGQLFELINISVVSDTIAEKWFYYCYLAAAFGLGIALARERPKVIMALLNLVLTLFRVLAPMLAAIILVFLVALAFTGIEVLWKTDLALPIFITSIFLFVLFANAVVQTGETGTKYWKSTEWLLMGGVLALPILAALAIWGLSLRVSQYGWTPPRIYSAALLFICVAYGVTYSIAVLWKRLEWNRTVTLFNPFIAWIILILVVAINLPPLEPFSLSARDQFARLKDGRIAPEDFDFAYLKFKLGEAGKKTLDQIEADSELMSNQVIASRVRDVQSANYYSNTSRNRKRAKTHLQITDAGLQKIEGYMLLFPENAKLPETLFEDQNAVVLITKLRNCATKAKKEGPICILLNVDFNNDGVTDVGLISTSYSFEKWLRTTDGKWKLEFAKIAPNQKDTFVDLKTLADAVKRGDVSLKPRTINDVVIGGQTFQ